MQVLAVDDRTFEDTVLKSDIPVLVDFYAQWCMPCKMVAPLVEEISSEYSGKLKCCKVDIDDAMGIASSFGIMSIPTVLLFKDGKVVDQVVGAVSKEQLKSWIDKNI